ncbi:TonB-dependent receptor [Porphyromonas levii]|uniref:TonB-dependent receptor n=1 Tax=Porphyromonas levii TaxID=28114 RepID=UPI00037EDA61|nr:carboxypeptidase-like regulatory domain-containing protein [Porphyromonas levii]
MRLLPFYLAIVLSLISISSSAQTIYSARVVDEKGVPIQDVNVMLYRTESTLVGYAFTGVDGRFQITTKKAANPIAIGFMLLGYETRRIKIEEFRSGMDIKLQSTTFELREVNVTPERVRQKQDTLVYSVSNFKLSQDRSIADVIKKMPGLSVRTDGQITFEGKPINKFYIEGLDLLGSKYAQASENLSADKIQDVQILQNHQPIRSLKGVQFSEQAALNIILKDEVKNAWTGILNAGIGSTAQGEKEMLYSGRLMGMIFGRQMQNLSMYKYDNTGKDITREVHDLVTELRGNQKEAGLLRRLVAPAAEIERGRSTFNQSHLVTTNHLIKTKNDNDLRFQLSYFWDKERGNSSQVTKYLEHEGSILSEESSVGSRVKRLEGELTYKINKERNYINNRINGSFTVDRSEGTSLLQQKQVEQNVVLKKYYVTEDFEIIHRLKNGNTIEGASLSTYSSLPGQLLTAQGFSEHLKISAFSSDNYVAFNHSIKGFMLNQRIGYQLKHQEIDVQYPEVDSKERYTQQNWYISTGVNYRKDALALRATLKGDLLWQKYGATKKRRFTFQPSLFIQYEYSANSTASLSYNYFEYPDGLTSIYRTPIYTSYRVVTAHTGSLEHRGNHAVALGLKYQRPIKGYFASINASWNRRTNEVLYHSTLQSSIYRQTPTEQRYDASSYLLSANLAKSFFRWRTLITLKGRQLWSDYYLLMRDKKEPWQMQNSELSLAVSMQPSKVISYEVTSKMMSYKQANKADRSIANPRITSFSHALELFIFPLKNLELGSKSEFYHYTDKSIQGNVFTDAHVSYKKDRYEFRLSCRNIFGNNQYQRRWQTSTTDIYSIFHIRPREVFFDFTISL